MSFPVIADNNYSTEAANTTSHTVNLPANIAANDLLIVFFAADGNDGITWPAGWTKFFTRSQTLGCTIECAWRKATGSEGGTIVVTSAGAQKSAHGSWHVTGAENPSIQPPEASSGVSDNSVSPDSDNLVPVNGVRDYLWVSVEANDNDVHPTAHPSGMTPWSNLVSGSGTGECTLGVAYLNNSVASYNPAAWTLPSAQRWNAGTIAISPPGKGNTLFLGFNF